MNKNLIKKKFKVNIKKKKYINEKNFLCAYYVRKSIEN